MTAPGSGWRGVYAKGVREEEVSLGAVRGHGGGARGGDQVEFVVGTTMAELEQRAIDATLVHTEGDKQLAAQLLGISARTIYRKLAERDAELGGGEGQPAAGDILS